MSSCGVRLASKLLSLPLVLMAVTATVLGQSDGPSVFVTNTPRPPVAAAVTPYPESLVSAAATLNRASEAHTAPNPDSRVLARLQGATTFPIFSHYLTDTELWYGILLPDGSPWLAFRRTGSSAGDLAQGGRDIRWGGHGVGAPGCFMMGSETG
jgi:hypothetical protein